LQLKKVVWIRRAHKWLALVAGIQVTIWAISGLYMTVIDLDIIHGNHLVKPIKEPAIDNRLVKPISDELLESLIPVKSIELVSYFGHPVYEIATGDKSRVIVDATTGKLKQQLTPEQVRENVSAIYAGNATIKSIEKLSQYPSEIGGRKLPVWKVEFDDALSSTLYFHHSSGRLVSKRSHLWRVFDVFWVLHIMDFFGSQGFQGFLFRIFSLSGLLLTLFGAWLLVYRLQPGAKL
jgi:uncharacterized iron-regulated membrane protein